MSALAPAMQSYFSDRLIAQRGASPNTIAAYCQTFGLSLGFASKRTSKPPSELDIAHLDAPLIAAFRRCRPSPGQRPALRATRYSHRGHR
jgi:integrase/recombinase XerD